MREEVKYIFLGQDSYAVFDDFTDTYECDMDGWIVCGRIKDKRIQPICIECNGEGCYSCDHEGFYSYPRLSNVIEIIEKFKQRTGITEFGE